MNSSVYINNALSSQIHSINIMPGLTAGLVNGLVGGISAAKHGGNFWTGDGMTIDCPEVGVGLNDSKTIEIGKGLEYSNEYAKKFSDDVFGKIEYLKKLYADETLPPNHNYRLDGDIVYNNAGIRVSGTTEYSKKGCNVYLYKSAFVNKETLYLTMGHEYLHIAYWNAGYKNNNSYVERLTYASIYEWQYQTAKLWEFSKANGYNAEYLKYMSKEATTLLRPSDFGFYPINIKPW